MRQSAACSWALFYVSCALLAYFILDGWFQRAVGFLFIAGGVTLWMRGRLRADKSGLNMNERPRRDDEVRTVRSADGRTAFVIGKRSDGRFHYYVDEFIYDDELETDYWRIDHGGRRSGIFSSADEAEAEIRTEYARLF